MVDLPRPVFQHQGPSSNCKIDGLELGWKTCTAYSMAMGIDAFTGGERRPAGCKIRGLSGGTTPGLTPPQAGAGAPARYRTPVALRRGRPTHAPNQAAPLPPAGRRVV